MFRRTQVEVPKMEWMISGDGFSFLECAQGVIWRYNNLNF